MLSDQQRRLVAEMEEEVLYTVCGKLSFTLLCVNYTQEEIVEDDSDVLSQLQAALDADFTSPPPSLSPTPPPTPPPEPARVSYMSYDISCDLSCDPSCDLSCDPSCDLFYRGRLYLSRWRS